MGIYPHLENAWNIHFDNLDSQGDNWAPTCPIRDCSSKISPYFFIWIEGANLVGTQFNKLDLSMSTKMTRTNWAHVHLRDSGRLEQAGKNRPYITNQHSYVANHAMVVCMNSLITALTNTLFTHNYFKFYVNGYLNI